jgi:ethanolamine utilization microcompartment shell protein EutL
MRVLDFFRRVESELIKNIDLRDMIRIIGLIKSDTKTFIHLVEILAWGGVGNRQLFCFFNV